MNKEIHNIFHKLSPNACFLLIMILAHNDNINTLESISLDPRKTAYYIMMPREHERAIEELIYYNVLKLKDEESWLYWINSTVIWELTKYIPKPIPLS